MILIMTSRRDVTRIMLYIYIVILWESSPKGFISDMFRLARHGLFKSVPQEAIQLRQSVTGLKLVILFTSGYMAFPFMTCCSDMIW